MGLPDLLRRIAGVGPPAEPLAPRHERREAVRERHASGGDAWEEQDRHENEDGTRMVEDITPRTPGWGGSRRAGRG
jgi:hypothetical protein